MENPSYNTTPQQGGQQAPQYAQPQQPVYQQQVYSQSGQQPQAAPQQGPASYQQTYAQRPVQTARPSSSFDFNGLINEYMSWVKALFSADYTESVNLAKRCGNPFAWTPSLLLIFLLWPISRMLLSLRYSYLNSLNIFQVIGTFFLSMLGAIFVFAMMSGALILSQLVFKEFDSKKWYVPMNAAAVCLLPRIIIIPVNMIFGLISHRIFSFPISVLTGASMVMSFALMYQFMKQNRTEKANKWIMTGIIVLYHVLSGVFFSIG